MMGLDVTVGVYVIAPLFLLEKNIVILLLWWD